MLHAVYSPACSRKRNWNRSWLHHPDDSHVWSMTVLRWFRAVQLHEEEKVGCFPCGDCAPTLVGWKIDDCLTIPMTTEIQTQQTLDEKIRWADSAERQELFWFRFMSNLMKNLGLAKREGKICAFIDFRSNLEWMSDLASNLIQEEGIQSGCAPKMELAMEKEENGWLIRYHY